MFGLVTMSEMFGIRVSVEEIGLAVGVSGCTSSEILCCLSVEVDVSSTQESTPMQAGWLGSASLVFRRLNTIPHC